MNARGRGCLGLLGFLVFAAIFCGLIPFIVLPNAGIGMALPVIEVPGEVVIANFLPSFNLTNTIIGTVVTDILLLLAVFILWRASKGWTKEVPGRAQAMFEVLVEGLYGFLYNIGGEKLKKTAFLWPLVATIFFFLLFANYMKLFPGAESVGYMHCAYAGQSGYAMTPGWTDNSYRLWVGEPLNAGNSQTAETEEICNAYFNKGDFEQYPVDATAEDIEAELTAAEEALVVAEEDYNALTEEDEGYDDASTALSKAEHKVEFQEVRLIVAQNQPNAEEALALVEERLAALEGEEAAAEDEEAAAEEEAEGTALFQQEATDLSDVRRAFGEFAPEMESYFVEQTQDLRADVLASIDEAEAAETAEAFETALGELESNLDALLSFYNTQLQYPTATITLSQEELESGAVPFIFHITPFVRGPATDLSLTFALAIMSIVLVQIYGVMALGPAYFEKFVNISAAGNVAKRPFGVVDVIAGFFEIISEIGKIVSLAFRLFGNLFAGGVALMAVTFLVSLFVPLVIYGLELIIGAVQALVFAVLTLVFAVQAMEGHHGEHDDEHHEAEAAH